MTKIEIYNDEKVQQDSVLRLALREYSDGIMVVAVDGNGDLLPRGRLVEFTVEGNLRLRPRISPVIPVKTTSSGRMRII